MALHALLETLGKGPRPVIHVPVKSLREVQPLRGLQTERVNVGDKEQERCKFLPACGDAEFGRLLDRVGRIGAGIGKADNLGLGGLRLQQEGGEISGADRSLDTAEHLAAYGL